MPKNIKITEIGLMIFLNESNTQVTKLIQDHWFMESIGKFTRVRLYTPYVPMPHTQ
jgi:hypothetical protein